jgi:hypothetical protein
MTDRILEDEEQKDEDRLLLPPKLKLLTGGKGPPGHDWLMDLDKGSVFLARPKDHKGFELTQYRLRFKFTKTALIRAYLPEREFSFYVDTKRFSTDMDLVELVDVEEDDE